MISIDEIMTTELRTLSPADSVYDARLLMKEHGIRHVPVVDKNSKLVGVITLSDVLAASESSLIDKNDTARIEIERDHLVSEAMTASVETIDENDNIRVAALHLLDTKHGCLPVTRDGKLVGIITDSDFVGVAVNLMEIIDQQILDEDAFN